MAAALRNESLPADEAQKVGPKNPRTSPTLKTQEEPAKKAPGNRLEGIVYIDGAVVAIIDNEIYRTGSDIYGAKVMSITPNKMTLKFPDREKEYAVGDSIP